MDLAHPGLDPSFLLLAGCIFIAYTVEATAGFGSILVALTLGAQLLPVHELVPVLVPLSAGLASYIAVRHRAHVDVSLLLRRILPFMVPGVVLGFFVFVSVPSEWLKRLLGVFVVGVAAVELWRALMTREEKNRPLGRTPFAAAMFGAGVSQGVLATGGPVLVYALGRLALPKARFRATLALVWICLDTGLVASYVATGRLGAQNLLSVAFLVPVVVCALAFGEWLHHRLDERDFKNVVFVLLAGAGVALVV
jgi:uncharacterized membrane protein YfcA